LTSEEGKERNRATLLLSELLHHAPVCLSHGPTLSMLLKFYCSRLHDYPSVNPCLHGLIALFDRHIDSMLEQHATAAVEGAMRPAPVQLPVMAVFEALDMTLPSPVQGLAQSIRSKIFALLLRVCACIRRHPCCADVFDLCAGLEEERARSERALVTIVCNSVEGEKDPRCLLLTLRLVREVLQLFPGCLGDDRGPASKAANTANRVYGAVACYFPITFTPPPFVSAEDAVTPEQLTEALSAVLCCHPGLLEHTVPFLVDQLVEALDSSETSVAEQSNTIVQALAVLARSVAGATGAGEAALAAAGPLHAQLAVYHRALRDALHALSTSLLLDNKDIVAHCDRLLARLTEFCVCCDVRGLTCSVEGGGSLGASMEPSSGGGCCGGGGKSSGGCCGGKGQGKSDARSAVPLESTLWRLYCGWVVDTAVHELSGKLNILCCADATGGTCSYTACVCV
jgi:hypothetical protein